MESPEAQLETLRLGVAHLVTDEEFLEKLRLGRPLTVKMGINPISPDIHLGLYGALRKLRQFQDFGHRVVLVMSDFTAMLASPGGRGRNGSRLTHGQVMANAASFQAQAHKFLDPARTRIAFNGEWFEMMSFDQVLELNSKVTLQQMMHRDDIRRRVDDGEPVPLDEVQYAIMQGWDSVKVRADVEVGGTDQLFNSMVGRALQREESQPEQVVMLLPLLPGLDGARKMSRACGKQVGIADCPHEQFGKLMSISDETMGDYYRVLFGEPVPAIHPMEAKERLALRVVEMFHGAAQAQAALQDFVTRFSQRDLHHAELPSLSVAELCASDLVTLVVSAFERAFSVKKSRTEARRLIEQGSVQWCGEKLTDPKATPSLAPNGDLRLDKTHAIRLG